MKNTMKVITGNNEPTRFFIPYISVAEQESGRGNFRENGKLYLLRCYSCGGSHGKENYMPMVASGKCAWCGWDEAGAST